MITDLNFVAIDFETANADLASVCQVGITKVINGEVADSQSWLIQPPTGISSFSPKNIEIHGTKPKDVVSRGISWKESLAKLSDYAKNLPVVAHNSSFDRNVFIASSEKEKLETPQWSWYDSLALSRLYLDLPNHKLPLLQTI